MTWNIRDPFGFKRRAAKREKAKEEAMMADLGITWEMRRVYDAESAASILSIFEQNETYLNYLRARCAGQYFQYVSPYPAFGKRQDRKQAERGIIGSSMAAREQGYRGDDWPLKPANPIYHSAPPSSGNDCSGHSSPSHDSSSFSSSSCDSGSSSSSSGGDF